MFKKSIFALLILMLVMPAGSSFARSGQPLDIIFNGKKMVFTGTQPFLEGTTVLVPVRPIAEELGADLQWDAAKGKLTVKTFAWTAILGMGSKQMKINEKTVALTAPPRVVKSAAVVPLAALEAIGMTVSWSKSRNTVSLEPEFTVVKKYVLPVLVASVRYRGQYEEIADTYTALEKQVKSVKNGKGFSMYYEQNYELGHDTEVCIPVREAVKDTFIEHKGTTIPVKTRMLEGGYFLSVVHQGTPDTLAKVWAQMEAYAATTNATILTPSREVYLHEDVKDYRKQVTEILLYIDNK